MDSSSTQLQQKEVNAYGISNGNYMSSNRFTLLTNLNENQTVEINPRTNCEWSSATNSTK